MSEILELNESGLLNRVRMDCFVLTKCPTPCRLDAPCWGITTWYNHNKLSWCLRRVLRSITHNGHQPVVNILHAAAFLRHFSCCLNSDNNGLGFFVWEQTKCELNTGQRPHTFPLIKGPDGFAEEDNCFIFSRSFSLMQKLIVSSQLICRPEKRKRASHVNIEFKYQLSAESRQIFSVSRVQVSQ